MNFWTRLKDAFKDRPYVFNDLTVKMQLRQDLWTYYEKYNCSYVVDMSVNVAYNRVPQTPTRLAFTTVDDRSLQLHTMNLLEWVQRKIASCGTSWTSGRIGPKRETDIVCVVLGLVSLDYDEQAIAMVEAFSKLWMNLVDPEDTLRILSPHVVITPD